jgi:hypothetical protein
MRHIAKITSVGSLDIFLWKQAAFLVYDKFHNTPAAPIMFTTRVISYPKFWQKSYRFSALFPIPNTPAAPIMFTTRVISYPFWKKSYRFSALFPIPKAQQTTLQLYLAKGQSKNRWLRFSLLPQSSHKTHPFKLFLARLSFVRILLTISETYALILGFSSSKSSYK